MHRIVLPLLVALFLIPPSTARAAERSPERVALGVPHVWEIPDGVWVRPWSGACEEASIIMIDRYYTRGSTPISRPESKALMYPLFGIETSLFGYNTDTNAAETARLMNDYSSVEATPKYHPSLDDLKNELRAGRPVITMHYGRGLQNPKHAWARGSSSYHVLVLVGFDDAKNEFIVNDSELQFGGAYRYSYDLVMGSLHDFDHKTNKADGPPAAVFTSPKRFLRAKGYHRIYLVRGNEKRYITRPSVFHNRRWAWGLVRDVDPAVIEALDTGAPITE